MKPPLPDRADRTGHTGDDDVPRVVDPNFDTCVPSKHGTHRFSVRDIDGRTCCAFCGRSFHDCLKVT